MHLLFEESDLINVPVECFYFNTDKEVFPVKPHWHYYMEIIYMLEGDAEMHSGNDIYTITEGDMILFYPQSVHSIYKANSSYINYAVFKLDINRMNITANYSPKLRSIFRYAQKENADIVFPSSLTKMFHAEEIFRNCILEKNAQRYGFDLVIRSDIYKLLIGILRTWLSKGFVIGNDVYAQDSIYDIYSITEYIDNHMNTNLKVSEIADVCGMSYSYFAKKFPLVYGKSCKEYIEEMRIYKAEEFLIFTDFDLTYISQEIGFSDCSHLINSFKKVMGITPKQFRLKYKNKQLHN